MVSPWKASCDGKSYDRKITYHHPVPKVPMAPESSQATKQQRLTRIPKQGIIVETKTIVEGVPFIGCFRSGDCLIVEDNFDGSVSVSSSFDIQFTQSTMFRGLVTTTAKGGINKFHSGFIEYMRNFLNDDYTQSLKSRQSVDVHDNVLPIAANTVTGRKILPSGDVTQRKLFVIALIILLVQLHFYYKINLASQKASYLEMEVMRCDLKNHAYSNELKLIDEHLRERIHLVDELVDAKLKLMEELISKGFQEGRMLTNS